MNLPPLIRSMDPAFHRELTSFHHLAQAQKRTRGPEDRAQFLATLDATTKAGAEFFSAEQKVHQTIYEIQRQKLGVMQRLKRDLNAIEEHRPIETPKEARPIEQLGERLIWKHREQIAGKREGKTVTTEVSLTDLLIDLEWGVTYALDAKTVAKHTRKQYAVAKARHEIEELTDQQLYAKALGDQYMDTLLQKAYYHSAVEKQKGVERDGLLTEKLIASQFKQWCLDHPELPVQVEHTDIQQDIEQKVDMRLRVDDWHRGVQIEAVPHVNAHFGVQITINTDAAMKAQKQQQLGRAKQRFRSEYDDIVLMTVEENLAQYVKAWRDAGKPPGGPLKLWKNSEQQAYLFRNALKDLLPPAQIEASWQMIQSPTKQQKMSRAA